MKSQQELFHKNIDEEKLKQQNQPILKTSIRKSNDGKWIIHETIIIDIKPIAYIEKCIA